ncbi:MAG: hypothetical protein LBG60_03270 [Bifidobacteriaceae bacterium]|nr:hypothetical protein [Bifidobacteriaceae bacterium]
MSEAPLGRLVRWAVTAGAFGALAAIAAATAWFAEHAVFAKWWPAAGLAWAAGWLAWRLAGGRGLAMWRRAAWPKWVLPVGLFAVFFAVKTVFAFYLKTEQQSDFLVMYQAAQSIAEGDFSFSQSAYWHFFAYQTPFALYQALMLKVFGGSIAPLLVVGALAMAGTNLLVFLIGRRITGSAVAGLFASFAYLAYPGPYLQANALTNDHLSACLLYLGAYLVVAGASRPPSRPARPRWALVAVGALVLQLGNLARPSGIVVVAALVAALVAAPIIGRRRKGSWRPLAASAAAAALAVAVYAGAGAAADQAVKAAGVNPAGTANNLPEWKFVFGLQGSWEQGRQDSADIGAYDPSPKPDARQIARAAVERDLRQLPQTWRTVLHRQVTSLWVLNESGSYLYWPQFEGRYRYQVPSAQAFTLGHYLVLGERGAFLPAVLLAAAGVGLLGRRRRWGALAAFAACLVAAYALVHLAIEVQPRYRYLVMPAVFALTAPAWDWLAGWPRRARLKPTRSAPNRRW